MLTKVLEQKWVIRLFGLALIIAPFLNIIISGEAVLAPGQKMTWALFREFVGGVPTSFKVLELGSLAIGALMLRGSASAWRFLLVLLGAYIVLQFVHLGHNVQTDKTAWLFIAVNILVFFFIADQLVLKPSNVVSEDDGRASAAGTLAEQAPVFTPTSLSVVAPVESAARVLRKNIVIDLNGFGKWAKLVDISPDGLRVRCLNDVPQGISSRLLSVTLGGVDLQLRYARQLNQEVVFEWQDLSPRQVQSLNGWIRDISA